MTKFRRKQHHFIHKLKSQDETTLLLWKARIQCIIYYGSKTLSAIGLSIIHYTISATQNSRCIACLYSAILKSPEWLPSKHCSNWWTTLMTKPWKILMLGSSIWWHKNAINTKQEPDNQADKNWKYQAPNFNTTPIET